MNHYVIFTAALALLVMGAGIGSADQFCWDWGDETGTYKVVNTNPLGSGIIYYYGEGEHLWIKWYASCSWSNPPSYGANLKVLYRDSAGCVSSGSSTYLKNTQFINYLSDEGIHEMTGGTNNKAFVIEVAWAYVTSTDIVTIIVSDTALTEYTISGTTECVSTTSIWINMSGDYTLLNSTSSSSYSFSILDGYSYRILFDSTYYDFTCDGNEVFDYDACIWVYGYTCGTDSIKLYVDTGGSWVLDDTESQTTGYDGYEMPIVSGEDYLISFSDRGTVCHNQTFACTGDHVNIDYDRCEWVYPPYPPAPPYPIYIWTGYDYNIVVFKDAHGNFIENSQLAIYDKTANQYIQRWTDASDGYTLLGARFNTDHDVKLSLRTFDGIFTLDTTYPANGSALVGEEDIATTNWTIPIKYNLNVLPVDQYGTSLFDVFCGLSEYTPLNPGAFWGMDLSDQGYVAVTNCSGFAMCDIIAEKEGYVDYKVEALNWTSKSALVKDYRHNVVMEEE